MSLSKKDLQKITSIVKTVINKTALTKKEAKRFATKEDLIGLARSSELDELKITFLDNLAKWKSELFDKIDKTLGELQAMREEHAVLSGRQSVHSDQLEDHEVRIKEIEEKTISSSR